MGLLAHIYPFGNSIFKNSVSYPPLLDREKPFSEDVHEEEHVVLPRRRRRMFIAETLALIGVLVVLSGIVLTAFAVLPRWLSRPGDETSKSAPLPPNGVGSGLYLPEGYMEHVLAHHGMNISSLSLHDDPMVKTHRLHKRGAPFNQKCGPNRANDWVTRVCDTTRGPTSFNDLCRDPRRRGGPLQTFKADCGADTHCLPYIDESNAQQILCLPDRAPNLDTILRDRDPRRLKVTQYGHRVVDAPNPLKNRASVDVNRVIGLQETIPGASVAAVYVDAMRTFAIAPRNEMNANQVGFTTKLCVSGRADDPNGGRGCKPTRIWFFNKDDRLTINFAIEAGQRGFLFYSIVGR